METRIKSASVKIMLSYDYSHFETCMSLENAWYGYTTLWLNRQQLPFETLGDKPAYIATSLNDVQTILQH